ncbi:MAG: phage/plasmid primase, P4 family [Phascolarctobacterium sp.]|nr:phage/plasmid primase, P4 family [Phascolarctobacterium sp.]
MQKFTIYIANVCGVSANCLYPKRVEVADAVSFAKAMLFDHVCGTYKNNYRANDNFLSSNVLPMDCDNDHSDNPADWVTPKDVAACFAGCAFAVSYSRNHLKAKGSKIARPRFHIYFPIPLVTSGREYAALKKRVQAAFPYFDGGALGEARFFFGTREPQVEIYEGSDNVVNFLSSFEANNDFAKFDASSEFITEGNRNNAMSRVAARIIKRYGSTEAALSMYMEAAKKCNPPLSSYELKQIWQSASKFGKKIAASGDYIPPEIYNSTLNLKPEDYSDVGQANVLVREYGKLLRYSPATDFLVYNGSFWEESAPKSQGLSQELTDRQLAEADQELARITEEMRRNGTMDEIISLGPKKAVQHFNPQQAHTYELYENVNEYRKFAIKRRESKAIFAALKESMPGLEIDQKTLDKDEFALNCPAGTWDLREGLHSQREHCPEDFITKQTLVDPSAEGEAIWQEALRTFFTGDAELIDYVQRIVGLASIGKVYVEALIIAYGEGRNGKSTFWNAVSRVLGTYSGNISADMLTVGCRRNVKPELAEAKGKRLLIAAELEEGMRLNTSNVKQLCSTDEIFAEKKFKDPFSYIPTHTLVLYTNHLPRVGAIDRGTWRRLIVIPFNATIEGKSDIKNYADYLVKQAGGAILSWIIQGAQKVIASSYHIEQPAVVKKALASYKDNNDWLAAFLDDACEFDEDATVKSGDFYNHYRAYCAQNGEYIRSTTDFYAALDSFGLKRFRNSKGRYVSGIRMKSEFFE